MRVLVVTSEWPNKRLPYSGTFIVQQVKYLRKHGVTIDVIAFQGKANPFAYSQTWLNLHRQARRYDLVHAHFGQSGVTALPKNRPLVVTFHGSDVQQFLDEKGRTPLRSRILQLISRTVARAANQAILVSSHLARYLPERKYHVIPCGVDRELFHPISRAQARQRLSLPEQSPIVFFGASPKRHVKRYALAEAAIQMVREEIPNVLLVAAGNIEHSTMPLYLNACDVLVVTSEREGSPTIVKEALACNLPIVSVSVGDIPEQIKEVQGCILCKDEQPQTIARGLSKVLSACQRIDGQPFAEIYSEDVLTSKIISVYVEALRGV